MLQTAATGMTDIVYTGMIERTRLEERDIQTGREAIVHVFVDNVICFASDETGFEEIVAELTDAGIGSATVCAGDSSI